MEVGKSLYKKELERADRVVRRQEEEIRGLREKMGRCGELIYGLRRKGVDVDAVYLEEVAGVEESENSEDEGQSEGESNREENGRQQPQQQLPRPL